MKSEKTLLFYFFLTIFLFTNFSCKKDNLQHTTASGIVVEANTENPVPNSLVQVITQKHQFMGYGGYSIVDSVRTDAKGKFYFSFQADDDFSYFLQAKANKFIDNGTLTGIINGKRNNENLSLQPEAFLKLYIKNIYPYDDLDRIGYEGGPNSAGGEAILNGKRTYWEGGEFIGRNVDVAVKKIKIVNGNSSNQIYYNVRKNGVNNSYTISIYCPAHDTTTYTIEY